MGSWLRKTMALLDRRKLFSVHVLFFLAVTLVLVMMVKLGPSRVSRKRILGSGKKSIMEIQQERLDRLHKYCAKRPIPLSVSSLEQIYVDDKHKVLYCAIPKAGCSAWKWNLMALSTNNTSIKLVSTVHEARFQEQHGLRKLHSYSKEQIVARVQQYYKFTFVRHPITRLLSGYKNKFVKDKTNYFLETTGPKILKHVGRKAKRGGAAHYNITFNEFLSYLFSEKNILLHDEHFENYTPLCSPCALKYDFIGKQETFNDDTNYLMEHIFNKSIVTPDTPFMTHSGKDVTAKVFLEVPKSLRMLAAKHYAEEIEMFGYDMHGYI